MIKTADYLQSIKTVPDLDAYLMRESGLPGPRANLELAHTAAKACGESDFQRWLTLDVDQAPTNSQPAFLVLCGLIGFGRLLAEGKKDALPVLRKFADDTRWRMREGVVLAMQYYGDFDMPKLLTEMRVWAAGSLYEKRAAAAILCEPRLLRKPELVHEILELLDGITASLLGEVDRKTEPFRVLRQSLGYCWSVAVVALPEYGLTLMEKWLANPDRDIAWIMRENLKKTRLQRLAPDWVARWEQ